MSDNTQNSKQPQSLTITFNSATRDKLYEFFTDLIKTIPKAYLLKQSGHPCFIIVNGDEASGKSILWDIAREVLFDQHTIEEENSITQAGLLKQNRDNFRDIRVYEAYAGISKTNVAMRLICANAHALSSEEGVYADRILKRLQALYKSCLTSQWTADPTAEDFIILSNALHLIGFGKDTAPVEVNIEGPHDSWEGAKGNWTRITTVTFRKPILINAAYETGLVNKYSM